MPFWDHEPGEQQQARNSGIFALRARRSVFNRTMRRSVETRGMDPDMVLGPNISVKNIEDPRSRAQALGVSAEDYKQSTPDQRLAMADYEGTEGSARRKLLEKYTPEQVDILEKVRRRAEELVPEDIERPHYDEKGRVLKGSTYDEEYQKATEKATKELGWNEAKTLGGDQSFLGGLLENFGSLLGRLETADPIIGGPMARTTEYGAPDPEGRTMFERGADISRPVAEAVLPKQLEDTIVEDILTEVINPAAVVLVVPLAGQGVKVGQMSVRAMAAKMGSNLLGTGMEPEMIGGVLRAASKGPAGMAKLPGATKEALNKLGGFTKRARTGTLRGGPTTPTIKQFQDHYTDMGVAVERADTQVKYIREEVTAGRMNTRAMDEATVRASDARTNQRVARRDLDSSLFGNERRELLEAAERAGGDEGTLKLLAKAFDDSVAQVPGEEVLMNVSGARHWLATAVGHITGTPPGVVGRLAHHRNILLQSLRRRSYEVADPVFRELNDMLMGKRVAGVGPRAGAGELGNIRPNASMPKKWRTLAEGEYKPHHIIQHPEWFDGMSPALKAKMDEAQELMLARLETAKALGYPIEVKDGARIIRPLDNAYLEQLWEVPSKAVGSHFLPGRVSVAKPRLFDDYFMGLTQGYTPQAMSVEELMQHSTGLLDQAISDAWMKQEVVRRFGSKHPGKAIAGKAKFDHTLYRDWYGPTEVVSWLDEMEAPVGRRLRQVGNVSAALRGTVFGLTDIAVTGVQFPLSLAHGGLQMGVGTLNRSLNMLGTGFHLYAKDATYLGRAVGAVSNGLELTLGPSAVSRKGGTVVKYVYGLEPVEKVVSGVVDAAAQAQFGFALSGVRLRMYEGNLIILKMSGENIFDPRVRRMAAEWANSASGASRGPMVKGRRAVESTLLTSVQMTRSNMSVYGQFVKALGPKAGKMERLRAAMTLANLGAYTYGIQYLFNNVLGDGPQQWVPGRSDWATIRIGGRTVPIIPQRSLLRAIDKSVKILSEEVGATDTDRYSLSDIAAAWSQVAVGKASPLAGIATGAVGIGFEPGTGKFEMGGLSGTGRAVSALPIPPLVEQAVWQERDSLSLAIAGLGFNPYDTSSGVLLREEFGNKFGEELNWESPAHREDIEQNSRLNHLWEKSRSESREYGSEDAIASEEIRQVVASAEEDKGIVRLAEAVLDGDPFATVNWSEERGDFLTWRSGLWDTKLTGKEPRTEIGKLVSELYSLNPKDPKYTNDQGETNWGLFREDRDAIKAQMPQADREAIENNEKFTNPAAEKVDKEFRAAQDKLRDYWDVEDKVWGQLRKAHGGLRQYESMDELREEKIQGLLRQGVPEEEILWRLNSVPILSQLGGIIDKARFNYRLTNPEVDDLLVKWYGRKPASEQVAGGPPKPPQPPRAPKPPWER